MSLTIVATVGAADANSYVTLAEANAYMLARLNVDAWDNADDAGIALAEATREIDLCSFLGCPADDDQALQWPRSNVRDPDAASLGWNYYATNVIPQRVKNATCELALEFLRAGTTDISKPDTSGQLVRKRVDVIEKQYSEAPASKYQGLARYPRILAWLRPLLASSGGQINIVRG